MFINISECYYEVYTRISGSQDHDSDSTCMCLLGYFIADDLLTIQQIRQIWKGDKLNVGLNFRILRA